MCNDFVLTLPYLFRIDPDFTLMELITAINNLYKGNRYQFKFKQTTVNRLVSVSDFRWYPRRRPDARSLY
jgi:hypothetical protein